MDDPNGPVNKAAAAFLGGNPSVNSVVLDASDLITHLGPDKRFAAVYRTPSGLRVLGFYPDPLAATVALDDFWTGMRALFAPA